METTESVSLNETAPVEKAGLSILALILSIVGLIVLLFHCLGDFPSVAAALPWLPTLSGNPGMYWALLIIAAVFVIAGSAIADVLKKRKLGIVSVNKVTLALTWVFCIMILISIFVPKLF